MERTTLHDIAGMRFDKRGFYPSIITARITSDEWGKSLSLSDDKEELMLQIALEPIEERLKEVLQVKS